MTPNAEFLEAIKSIFDGIAMAPWRLARDREPGDRVQPPGTLTPSELAIMAHRAMRERWPDTADRVIVRCEWNDACPWRPRVFFARANNGEPITFLLALNELLEPSPPSLLGIEVREVR